MLQRFNTWSLPLKGDNLTFRLNIMSDTRDKGEITRKDKSDHFKNT